MNTVKKTLMNLEVLNILNWADAFQKERSSILPIRIRWTLKKNLSQFDSFAKMYVDFYNELSSELSKEFLTDEKSSEVVQPVTDENGKIIDEQKMRVVNEEYREDFQKKSDELNNKLNSLLEESEEYTFSPIDVDAIVNQLSDEELNKLTFEDLQMLEFCIPA